MNRPAPQMPATGRSFRRVFTRALGRFRVVRMVAWQVRAVLRPGRTRAPGGSNRIPDPGGRFGDVDVRQVCSNLRSDGLSAGLTLPDSEVQEILEFADSAVLFADRRERHGFAPADYDSACSVLGKKILVAQYFNVERDCTAVQRISTDPVVRSIAAGYLRSEPVLVGVNLWWTYPVMASAADRDLHAHRFHRDVDALGFVKFFFYLTNVEPGDGGHVCAVGTHRRLVAPRLSDRFLLRRLSDEELSAACPSVEIRELVGPPGTGFVEDTFCFHKGLTPTRRARLVLQIEFALHDDGMMHDRRPSTELALLAPAEPGSRS
jgi:hypothetical protein